MKRLFVPMVVAALGASLMIAGCGPAAPAPTPTKAPAAPTKAAEPTKAAPAPATPTKAAEPTKAPTVAPTAVPAKKVDYPQKGRSISFIIPYPAGGATHVVGQILSAMMEREFGIPVQVVNKAGAGGQVGMTELANSKPDGYTVGHSGIPSVLTQYLDPERKAVYKRDSFQYVANYVVLPSVSAVQASSPYKTLKDVIDAAKAKPDTIKFGSTGILGPNHLAILQLQKAAGAKVAVVQFDGGAPQVTALLGGHVDVATNVLPEMLSPYKAGTVRALAITGDKESEVMPGVKTFEAQGYRVSMATYHGMAVPAGTPPEIVEILSSTVKKLTGSDEFKKKAAELGMSVAFMDHQRYTKFWADSEVDVRPLMELSK